MTGFFRWDFVNTGIRNTLIPNLIPSAIQAILQSAGFTTSLTTNIHAQQRIQKGLFSSQKQLCASGEI